MCAQKSTGTKAKPKESDASLQTVDALQESKLAIQQAIQEVVAETRKSLRSAVREAQQDARAQAEAALIGAEQGSEKLRPAIHPHVFVVMPFGKKKGADGKQYDFNAIYQDLIKPALETAGFEPFRADEETKSGDILTDMFQELLLADLVICDMSIDNANVYYELGIRHALRKRGVVHIQSGRAYMPFDVFNVRTIPYHTTEAGLPDPEYLESDIRTIARVTHDTWASERETIHSPIYNLLDGLTEPDKNSLRTPLATGFWKEYDEWKQRLEVAQRQKRIGDILVLTEEITNPFIKEEAVNEAGKALADMGRNELALEQYRKGLEINPDNFRFRREEAFHLNRIGRVDEAIIKVESLLADLPNESEATAYLGRIYKEMWTDSWQKMEDKEKRLQMAFDSYHWLIKSFEMYIKGYRLDLNNTYPGINAVTLATILEHLAGRFENASDPDPDIVTVREVLPELRGALEFTLETKALDPKADYWTLASLAELRVLTANTTEAVERAYRKALVASRRTLFYIESSIAQLEILRNLEMRPEFVEAGLKALQEEMERIRKDDYRDKGSKGKQDAHEVFLFAGYKGSKSKSGAISFQPETEQRFREAILEVLDNYSADKDDIAVLPGLACGSEIIFAEVCMERGIPVKLYLPTADAAYVRDFVSPGGDEWVARFYGVRNHPLVSERYQGERLGKPKQGIDIYERNNRWALYSSLISGVDRVRLIALWDGKSGTDRDSKLVKHMVDLMREMGGIVEQITPSKVMPIAQQVEKVRSRRQKKSTG
jgi:tetratricopeptide (TPR) repeat protein